jgi:hypothetical protein
MGPAYVHPCEQCRDQFCPCQEIHIHVPEFVAGDVRPLDCPHCPSDAGALLCGACRAEHAYGHTREGARYLHSIEGALLELAPGVYLCSDDDLTDVLKGRGLTDDEVDDYCSLLERFGWDESRVNKRQRDLLVARMRGITALRATLADLDRAALYGGDDGARELATLRRLAARLVAQIDALPRVRLPRKAPEPDHDARPWGWTAEGLAMIPAPVCACGCREYRHRPRGCDCGKCGDFRFDQLVYLTPKEQP